MNVVKTMMAGMTTIENITDRRRAATILAHPLRPRILAHAHEPVSASDLARRLEQPRQRVNYHVRQLAKAGFLQPAGRQTKRNMVEQQYVASARAYVLAPDVLADVRPAVGGDADNASAAHLAALCARAQSEVAQIMQSANAAGLRVRTMSMCRDVRFESVEQRAEFTKELLVAVRDVAARFSSPLATTDGTPAPGRPFRVVLGCYPVPNENSS